MKHTGLLYTYLVEGLKNTSGSKAFRTLQWGFTHWSAGRLDHLEINYKNPVYCHVRWEMTPSMKPGVYHVYILLAHDGDYVSIPVATCECAAGWADNCALAHHLFWYDCSSDCQPFALMCQPFALMCLLLWHCVQITSKLIWPILPQLNLKKMHFL